MSGVVLLYVTTPDQKAADQIADTLLNEGLVACTNRIPGMESKYHWNGKIETAHEQILILKTTQELAGRAQERARSLHPYDVPCLLKIAVEGGNGDYIAWLKGSLG